MSSPSLRVLIVEPNFAIRAALVAMIRAADSRLEAFEVTEAFLSRGDLLGADCVLMAEEFALSVNPDAQKVPFILLVSGTGVPDPRFADHIFRDAATPHTLSRKIHRAVEKFNLSREKTETSNISRSDDMARNLARRAPVGIFRTDHEGRCVYVNEFWLSLTGLSLDDALGDGWVDALHPDDRDVVFSSWQKAVADGVDFELEYRFVNRQGETKWVFGQAVAERGVDGEIYAHVGTVTDITNRRASEQQLRFQSLLLDAVQQAVIATDLDGRVTYWNKFAEELYGWSAAEVIGQPIVGLTTPPETVITEQALAILDEMVRGNRWSGEFVLQRRDGSRFPGFVSNAPVTDEHGNLVGLVGVSQDISAEKASDERFRLALDAASALVYDADLTGRRPNFAYGLERLTGYRDSDSDLSGKWWQSLIHPEDLPAHEAIYQKHLEDGDGTTRSRYRVRHQRGDWIWVEDTAKLVVNDGGRQLVGVIVDITEQKETEDRIRESEQRLRLATDSAGMFVWEFDVLSGRMTWSENASRVLGYAAGELPVTLPELVGFIAPDDRDHLRQTFLRALDRSESDFNVEFRGRSGRWWQAKGSIVRRPNGRAERVVAVTQDITERRRKDAELETANHRFRVAEEAAKGFSYEWDVASGLVTRSKSMENVLGYRPDDLAPTWLAWREIIHEDDATVDSEAEAITRIEASEDKSFIGEYRVRHKDGSWRWLMERGVLIRDAQGRPQRVIGQTLDVTARREADERLLAAERRAVSDYRKLLARIAPLGQTLGMARELTAVYRALLGFVSQEMPCEGFFISFYDAENQLKNVSYVWCEGREPRIAAVRSVPVFGAGGGANSEAISTGRTVITTRDFDGLDGELQLLGQKNPHAPIESIVTPMIVTGRVIGTIEVQNHGRKYFQEHVVALEMAASLAAAAIENVRMMEVQTRARSAAEEANRAKDEFLAVLSHELRTPLNSIKGWISMLQHHDLDDNQRLRAIDVIARNVNSQNALIEDILDVSRIISGKMRITSEPVSLVAVVRNVVDEVRPMAEKNGVKLSVELDPRADDMKGDDFRLQQIVSNLLSNAIKFTPFDGLVTVRLVRSGDLARLTVSDTGIGIASEFLNTIFERFQQADRSSRRRYGGLGLGLTIVRNLVELHGGTVSAASDGTGHGATFTVELPLNVNAANPAVSDLRPPETDQGVSAGGSLAGLRLLVVDDDADTLEMMRIALETDGAIVDCCLSAKEAIARISLQNFDVLVSDIGMAGMDGCDFVRFLREELRLSARELPAIALSGYVSLEDRARAEAAGFQSHIGKPVNFDVLRDTVVQLFGTRSATHQAV